jgi:hypothetical protein
MNKPTNTHEEAEAYLSELLDELLAEKSRLNYKEFYQRCLERLQNRRLGFAADFKLLAKALETKDLSLFKRESNPGCRDRERFCYKKIQALFESYIRTPSPA